MHAHFNPRQYVGFQFLLNGFPVLVKRDVKFGPRFTPLATSIDEPLVGHVRWVAGRSRSDRQPLTSILPGRENPVRPDRSPAGPGGERVSA